MMTLIVKSELDFIMVIPLPYASNLNDELRQTQAAKRAEKRSHLYEVKKSVLLYTLFNL